MRKLFLISALVLLSATAQAGQTRSLMLASNDTPASASAEKIDSIKPDEQKADVKTEAPATEAAKPATEASKPVVAEPAKPATDDIKPVKKASKPASKTKNYASDEARARSIAARYGVSW